MEEKILKTLMDIRKEMKERTKKHPRKFIGALSIELLRKELIKEGFNISHRDVYIFGLHNEFDLLVLKKKQKARENLLYKPEQVIAVLEIKFSGTYSEDEILNINKIFSSVRKLNKKIKCFYLTISENIKYKYYSKEKKIGDHAFFLFSRETNLKSAIKKGRLRATGDWDKLISYFKKIYD